MKRLKGKLRKITAIIMASILMALVPASGVLASRRPNPAWTKAEWDAYRKSIEIGGDQAELLVDNASIFAAAGEALGSDAKVDSFIKSFFSNPQLQESLGKVGNFIKSGLLPELGSYFFGLLLDSIFDKDDSTEIILAELGKINEKLDGINNKIDGAVKELKIYTDIQTVTLSAQNLNTIYDRAATLNKQYETILKKPDSTAKDLELKTFFETTLQAYDLPGKISQVGTILGTNGGGGQSLGKIYYEKCKKEKLYLHDIVDEINYFYQYHLANYATLISLYNRYCTYMEQHTESGAYYATERDTVFDYYCTKIASFAQDVHISDMTEDAKKVTFTGKDAAGNNVSYDRVTLNADGYTYIIVDKKYSMSSFYSKPYLKNSWGVTFYHAVETDALQKLRTSLPSGEGTAGYKLVEMNGVDDYKELFRNASTLAPGEFLKSTGIHLTNTPSEYGFLLSRVNGVQEMSKDARVRIGDSKNKKLTSPSIHLLMNRSGSISDLEKIVKKKTTLASYSLYPGKVTTVELKETNNGVSNVFGKQAELELNYYHKEISYKPDVYIIYKCAKSSQAEGLEADYRNIDTSKLTIKNESAPGAKDGSITGVTSDMLYTVDDGENWIGVELDSNAITGLAPGEVGLKYAGAPSGIDSLIKYVTIKEGGITSTSEEEKEEFSFGAGKVITGVDTHADTATARITNLSNDFIKKLLGDLLEDVEAGENISLTLDVNNISNKISADEENRIKSAASNSNDYLKEKINKKNTKIYYLDINLEAGFSGGTSNLITSLEKALEISIKLPEDMKASDSDEVKFFMIRDHEGELTMLDTKYNSSSNELSFASDLYSTYAIIRVDEKDVPATADTGNIVLFGVIMLLSFAVMAISFKRKIGISHR